VEPALQATVVAAGFEGFEVTWRKDVFEGAARPRQEVTAFGTRGINFQARKPE
jgi:hypothetical protein